MKRIIACTLLFVACLAVSLGQTNPGGSARYGGLYDFGTRTFSAVAGMKVKEIDISSKKMLNPEVWALGGATFGSGRSQATFNLALAQPWRWSPTITAYPLASMGIGSGGRPHLGLGGAIQITFKGF